MLPRIACMLAGSEKLKPSVKQGRADRISYLVYHQIGLEQAAGVLDLTKWMVDNLVERQLQQR